MIILLIYYIMQPLKENYALKFSQNLTFNIFIESSLRKERINIRIRKNRDFKVSLSYQYLKLT